MADQVVYRIVVDASQAMRTIDQMTAQSRAAIAELDRIASKPPSRRTKTDLNAAAQTAGAIKGDLVTQKKVAETRGDLQGKAAAERSLRELKTRIDSIFGRGTDESRAFRKIINDSARSFQRNIERSGQNYQLLGISIKDLAEETKRSKAEEKAARREAKAAAKRDAKAKEDAAQETNTATAEGKSQRARGKQVAEKKAKAEEKAAEAANKNTQETNKTTEETKAAGRRVAQATSKTAKAEEQRTEAVKAETIAQRLRTAELDKLSKTQQKNVQSALKKLETPGSRPLNKAEQATIQRLYGSDAVAAAQSEIKPAPVKRTVSDRELAKERAAAARDQRQEESLERVRQQAAREAARPALVLPEAPTTAASRGLYKSSIGSEGYSQQDYDAAQRELRERRRIANDFARREGILGPAGSRPGEKGYGVQFRREDPNDSLKDVLGEYISPQQRLASYNKLTKAQLTERAGSLGFTQLDTQGLNKADLAKLVAGQENARKLVDRAIKDSLSPGVGLGGADRLGFIPGAGKAASLDTFLKLREADKAGRSVLDPLAGTVIRSPQTKGENFTAYKVIDGALQQVQTSQGPLSGKTLKDLADNARKALETGEEIAKIDPGQARSLRNLNDRTARTQRIYAQDQAGIESRLKAGTIDPDYARARLLEIEKRRRDSDLRNQAAGNLRPLSEEQLEKIRQQRYFREAYTEAGRGKTFQDDGRLPANTVIDPATEAKLTRAQRAAVQKRIEQIQSESVVRLAGQEFPNLNQPGRGPVFQGARTAEDIAKIRDKISPEEAARATETTRRQQAAAEARRRADQLRTSPDLLNALSSGAGVDPNAVRKLLGNGVSLSGGQVRPSAATLESLPFKELREVGRGIGVTGKSREDITSKINQQFGATFKDLQQGADNLDKFASDLQRAGFGGLKSGFALPGKKETAKEAADRSRESQERTRSNVPRGQVAPKVVSAPLEARLLSNQLAEAQRAALAGTPGYVAPPVRLAAGAAADATAKLEEQKRAIAKAQQRDQEQIGRLSQRQDYGKTRGISIPSDPKLIEDYKRVLSAQQEIPGLDTAGLRKLGKEFGVGGKAKGLDKRVSDAVEKRRRELAKLVQQLNDEAVRAIGPIPGVRGDFRGRVLPARQTYGLTGPDTYFNVTEEATLSASERRKLAKERLKERDERLKAAGEKPGKKLSLEELDRERRIAANEAAAKFPIGYRNRFDEGAGNLIGAGQARRKGELTSAERAQLAREDTERLREARLQRGANADRLLAGIRDKREAQGLPPIQPGKINFVDPSVAIDRKLAEEARAKLLGGTKTAVAPGQTVVDPSIAKDLELARAARAQAERDAAAKTRAETKSSSDGGSSAAMITAQGEKAAAAHLVAEELLLEAASAEAATAAQKLKAQAALKVAAALEKQAAFLSGGTAGPTGVRPPAASILGPNGQPLPPSTPAPPPAPRTKPPVPTNAKDRVAEAKRQVKNDTNKNLLEAEILKASNDPSTKIGASSIASRKRLANEQALNAVLEQAIKVEAEILALKGRSKAQVARQASNEAQLQGLNLTDQNALLRARAQQGIATLEGEKLVLLAQENAAIQKVVGAQLARISINAKIVDVENQNAAYASLSASQKRRQAEADATAAVQTAEQNARRATAANAPALRSRLVDANATRVVAEGETKALTDAEVALRRRSLLTRNSAYKTALTEAASDNAKIALIEQEIATQAKINAAKSLTAAEVAASAALTLEGNLIKMRDNAASLKAQLASNTYAKAKAEEAVLQRQLNQQIRKEYRSQIRRADGIPLTEKLGLRGYGGPSGGGGGGGTFASSIGTTARYGASSFLLFGALGGLAASVKTAEELERTLNLVQSQFESLYDQKNFGGADEAFKRFRGSILDIAAVTGTSADEVANLAFQFQGAFGGNTVKTLSETQAAIQAVKVTGLSLKETIDAFTALTQSYRDQGVGISDVTDKALGLQERFGVLAKETISFAADLAPVGESAGFTVDQLEALGATAQKFSGKSGSSLAEAFGRIIPQVQANSLEFISLFRRIGEQVPEFSNALPDATAALGDNDVQKFFEILIPIYDKLGQAQKNYILDLVGSRRETQSLVGVLENGTELLAEWNGTFNDSGKASERFGQLQETLSQRLARFGEQLRQIGVEVFEGGLGDALKQLVELVSQLAGALGGILGAVGSVASAFDGFGAKLLIAVLGAKALLAVVKQITQANIVSGFTGLASSLINPSAAAAARVTATPLLNYGRPGSPAAGMANAAAARQAAAASAAANASRVGSLSAAGSGALSAVGGLPGLAAIGGLIGYQLVNGFVESAKAEYAANAEVFYSDMVEKAQKSRAEGKSGPETLEPGTSSFQSLYDVATGKRALQSKGGFFGDNSNIAETASNVLDGRFWTAYLPGTSDKVERQLKISDAEAEEAKRARQALVDLEAENFTQNLIELSSIQGVPNTGLLLAADSLYDTGSGANLISAANGSTKPEDIIAGLKADAQAKGEKLDLSKVGGKIDLNGEEVKFTAEDVEDINRKLQAKETLTDNEAKILTALRTQLSDNLDGLSQAVQDAVNDGLTPAELDTKLSDLDLKAVDFGKAFERGDISLATYLDEIETVASEAKALAGNDKKTAAEYAAKTEEARKARIDALKANLESFKLANELSGGDSSSLIQPLLAQLDNPALGKAERADIVSQYFTAQREVLDKMIGDANSTAEAIAIGQQGIAVDPTIQLEFVRQQLANYNTSFIDMLKLIGFSAETNVEITNQIAARIAETGETLAESTEIVLRARLNAAATVLRALQDAGASPQEILGATQAFAEAAKAFAVFTQQRENLTNPAEVPVITKGPATKQQEDQRRQEQFDIAKSRIDLAKARAGGNTVLQAQLQRQAAEIDLAEARANGSEAGVNRALGAIIEADRSGAEAVLRIQQAKISYFKVLAGANGTLNAQLDRQSAEIDLRIAQSNGDEAGVFAAQGAIEASFRAEADAASNDLKARLELQKARNGGDALANAKIDQQLADIDLQIAQRNGDIAGEAQALARRIEADRSVQNAMLAMREAQISVMLAQANALDDTVKAAELGVEQAQIALQKAQISGDPNAIKEAEAQIITANDALHDTQLRESIDAQQFLFDMGKISRGQFVEYLKGLIGMAGNSDKDVQAIQRQIKQLQGELSNDFQYNLPTSLGLPTLYESRRVSQATPSYAGALGAGYTDNRNVQININVSNTADQAAVVAALDSALGTPTTGTVPRRY